MAGGELPAGAAGDGRADQVRLGGAQPMGRVGSEIHHQLGGSAAALIHDQSAQGERGSCVQDRGRIKKLIIRRVDGTTR